MYFSNGNFVTVTLLSALQNTSSAKGKALINMVLQGHVADSPAGGYTVATCQDVFEELYGATGVLTQPQQECLNAIDAVRFNLNQALFSLENKTALSISSSAQSVWRSSYAILS